MSTVIPMDHFKEVCRPGEGAATCRYIVAGSGGIECAKHQSGLREQINRRVAAGAFVAQSDNCEGLQGDVR
jgi:hypothetical protein